MRPYTTVSQIAALSAFVCTEGDPQLYARTRTPSVMAGGWIRHSARDHDGSNVVWHEWIEFGDEPDDTGRWYHHREGNWWEWTSKPFRGTRGGARARSSNARLSSASTIELAEAESRLASALERQAVALARIEEIEERRRRSAPLQPVDEASVEEEEGEGGESENAEEDAPVELHEEADDLTDEAFAEEIIDRLDPDGEVDHDVEELGSEEEEPVRISYADAIRKGVARKRSSLIASLDDRAYIDACIDYNGVLNRVSVSEVRKIIVRLMNLYKVRFRVLTFAGWTTDRFEQSREEIRNAERTHGRMFAGIHKVNHRTGVPFWNKRFGEWSTGGKDWLMAENYWTVLFDDNQIIQEAVNDIGASIFRIGRGNDQFPDLISALRNFELHLKIDRTRFLPLELSRPHPSEDREGKRQRY